MPIRQESANNIPNFIAVMASLFRHAKETSGNGKRIAETYALAFGNLSIAKLAATSSGGDIPPAPVEKRGQSFVDAVLLLRAFPCFRLSVRAKRQRGDVAATVVSKVGT